ncbi:MAG: TonB-dependent receptor plug domain-containing protein [Dysgonamonadaceae bacterium]|nr:TonB-dependent receptor plug domain-containing protein [Dysgonamonadaceae bacterium]MDD3899646.1 TonB-dependent receptor plug domain-containing protein [Dysgonamonadaceae bacterium]MDD4398159.1 TonB-dependent receptor plug domain-containing protein [Dysgonamonadaceae bacterium]
MKFFNNLTLLFLVVIFMTTQQVFAQSTFDVSIDSLHQLPEVVVSEKHSDSEVRSTTPMQILSEQSIENLNALQVSDAVKHFSGVNVKDYGGIGGLKTVSVRSLGANHTAVGYNGITVSDVQTGQIDISRFSLDNVNMISLNNGQNDQIFQPARSFSSSSFLNIVTKVPDFDNDKDLSGKASFKTGSFGLLNPSLVVNFRINNKLSSALSAELTSANGQYPYILHYGTAGKDSTSLEQRQNTDVKNLRLEGVLFGNFSDSSNGNIRFYYYGSERGLPGATIYYNTDNFSKQRLWDKTFFTQAHYEKRISGKWSVQGNAKYNYGYVRYLDPTFLSAEGRLENIYKQNELYGSFSALYRAFENMSFSLATDVTHHTMSANLRNFANPTRLTTQSALSAKYVNNRILSIASLLYTHTFESVEIEDAAPNKSRFSPYLSLSIQPFEDFDLRIRAFYKNIFRLPTFNDLYYSIVGTRSLKPEDANQFNLGITYSTAFGAWLPLFKFTADVYHNNVSNKIIAVPNKNMFEWSMINYGEVKIDGLDVSVESAFKLPNNWNLMLSSAYTYQKALNISDRQSSIYGHQIPYTPRLSGSGRALIEMPWFNVGYSLIWSGARYVSSQNIVENRLDGYFDHSISVSKSILTKIGKLAFNIEAINLSNNNYQIVQNYPMPGRSYRTTLSFNF